ncbi:hypothetical protein LTR08_001463 [Meristemomyces frigidus]|nr:hypothetical protein LTR08_001463 [Meristemomyces frigidus]
MTDSIRRVFTRFGQPGRRTDAFLTHGHRILSSSAGVEAVLSTACYTLLFVHSRLRRVLERQYERLAFALVSQASEAMLPGETILATIDPPRTWLSESCATVKALADMTADVRMFIRLWGLVGIYSWARNNYVKPPGDVILKTLVWAQVGAKTLYQVLENGAYLASKGVLRGDRWAEREPKWWVWSNRFWLAHTSLEFLRLLRVRQLRYNEDFGAKTVIDENSDAGIADDRVKVQSAGLKRDWQRDLYSAAGWVPVTLHRSFKHQSQSTASEAWIGLCGMVPGVVGLVQAWEQTQNGL